MDRKFGYSIVLGLVIGAMFGFGIGVTRDNIISGLGLGGLFGVFIGWFVAAAVHEKKGDKKE